MNKENNLQRINCEDDIPESLRRFENAWDKSMKDRLSASQHNTYLLQTVDRDGNVTGTAYGVNLLTNNGFQNLCSYKYNKLFRNLDIYIGNGTNEPSLDNCVLSSPITTTSSTAENYKVSQYPLYYDSSTGIMTKKFSVYDGYFNYNISGVEEEKEITEIGLGYAYNSLATHALVYVIDDETGGVEKGSITKRLDERLYITVYFSASISKNLIESVYNKGHYFAIDPNILVYSFLTCTWPNDTIACFYKRKYDDNSSYGSVFQEGLYDFMGTNSTDDIADNNEMYYAVSTNTLLLESTTSYVSNIVFADINEDSTKRYNWDDFVVQNAGFLLFSKFKRDTPEEISCDYIRTNSYSTSSLTMLFGNATNSYSTNGIIPVTDFDISSIQMWDHTIKDWGINESFVNNPNCDYNIEFMGYVTMLIYVTFLRASKNAYVHVNINPDIPITSFTNYSGIEIYATDSYWDTDSWELINDHDNVEESLRTKRYYVTLSIEKNSGQPCNLTATRDQVYHSIQTIDQNRSYTYKMPEATYYSNNNTSLYVKPLSSDEYGYVVTNNCLWYIDSMNPDNDNKPYTYRLKSYNEATYTSNYYRWIFGDGEKVAIGCNTSPYYETGIRVYNISKDPSEEPTYEDIHCEFNSGLNYNKLFCTGSKNGFIVIQRFEGTFDEAVIVNVYGGEDGNTATQNRLDNVQHCYALDLSDNCVYVNTSITDIPTLEIYDMKNQNVVDSFTLPDSTYTVSGISGWKDFIYVRVCKNDVYSVLLYNMNTKALSTVLNFDSPIICCENNKHQVACVDECMVLFDDKSDNINYVITAADPENPMRLLSSSLSHECCSGGIKYMNEGRSLVFVTNIIDSYSFKINAVIDLGHVIDTSTPLQNYYSNMASRHGTHIGLYGNSVVITKNEYSNIDNIYLYPVENFVEHKMVGTTYTVNAYNNPVKIGSMQYKIGLTNVATKYE